jgi:hypothetical protein
MDDIEFIDIEKLYLNNFKSPQGQESFWKK